MTRSLVALWFTLIAAIVTISALAMFAGRQRAENAKQRVGDILQLQLEPYSQTIDQVLAGYSIELQRELANHELRDLQSCVALSRSPLVHALVVVDPQNMLHFPQNANLSTDQQSLVDEGLQLLREQPGQGAKIALEVPTQNAIQVQPTENLPLRAQRYETSANQLSQPQRPLNLEQGLGGGLLTPESQSSDLETLGEREAFSEIETFGWISWYHRRGMVLGFWWQQSNQWRCMVVLPTARWMADIVSVLPDMSARENLRQTPRRGALKQLIDVEGNLIYQWGDSPSDQWESLQAGEPDAVLALPEPLEGWRLRVFASENLRASLAGDNILLPLLLAVVGISASLLLVGAIVSVSLNRQLRLASQRVSFVNHVSHELRTPLTNITMYADMLAQSLDDADSEGDHQDALEKVAVIQSESGRLSRLIGNVLQFAQPESKARPLRRVPTVLDQLVLEVLEAFRPRLEKLGFELVVALGTPEQRDLDPDAIEQILVNLIGNAEKYAAAGKLLEISTHADGDLVTLLVKDNGPGVPPRFAEEIFVPFSRLSNRLEDPAGTGIGLTIVRQLARKHGGECRLLETQRGATLQCTLRAAESGVARGSEVNVDSDGMRGAGNTGE